MGGFRLAAAPKNEAQFCFLAPLDLNTGFGGRKGGMEGGRRCQRALCDITEGRFFTRKVQASKGGARIGSKISELGFLDVFRKHQ